ncbi:ABC transporter permease [Mucilaginibacter sp. CSA2-8R]|uniref:ABC transporter permease n=1 Tax=Mucilaginibacter sp. CSA2-8R TaxID=3141542 RepID=UPI00315D4011
MLKNQLKTALRNILKNKGYFAINVFGLAVGLATCLLICMFVMDELSYDHYNEKADRIYRINTNIQLNGTQTKMSLTPGAMADALKSFPAVQQVTRLRAYGDNGLLVRKGTETLNEHNAYLADATAFTMFDLKVLAGDAGTALTQPYSLVISQAIALKYFKTTNVVGQTLRLNNSDDYKITAVIRDMPRQSHVHFSFLRSMSSVKDDDANFWLSNDYDTYIMLRPGADAAQLNAYLQKIAHLYAEPQIQTAFHSNFAEMAKKGDYLKYSAIPLTSIHLRSDFEKEHEQPGNIVYVYTFVMIAVFILLLACVNFVNLSTARSAGRAKEVGVRKVLGSAKSNLVIQFLTESVVTSLVALAGALVLAWLFLPYFNQLSGKEISLWSLVNPLPTAALLLITVIIGALAGLYPALYLSAFEPVKVLKGRVSSGFKSSWLRNGLVVFQFATAIVLMICTLVIYNQLNYIRSKDAGYNREQVVVINNAYALGDGAKAFKNDVLQMPGVVAGTRASTLPTSKEIEWSTNAYAKDATMSASKSFVFGDWQIDADYLNTLGMNVLQGRGFSAQMPTDSGAVLINETAARMLGLKHPLQQKIYKSFGNSQSGGLSVIGVIKDFNAGSMRHAVQPVVFSLSRGGGRFAFRVKSNHLNQLLQKIENRYHAANSAMAGQPFVYSFMDDDFNKLYEADQRIGRIFTTFAGFAILIACLGLFGLITYAAEQRSREIGIRKVLGASVAGVTAMLCTDFMKLIVLAVIIAIPVAWLSMQSWLQGFAYRTAIHWWVPVAAAGTSLLIALSTLSYQAIKAALSNPVKTLRND